MELFAEFEKQLPAIRKRGTYLLGKVKPEERLKRNWKYAPAAAMIEWIWDELLDEHTILYQTFLRAGFTNKLDMSYCVFEWYLYDNRLQKSKQAVNRADTSPARE